MPYTVLKKFLAHSALADRKYLDSFLHYDVPLPQAELVFSHILNTQHLWISRINQVPQTYDRFHQHVVADFENLYQQNYQQIDDILASKNLEDYVSYTNMAGETYKNSIEDMLMNIASHSTYHRGQIATQFRRHGITPPVTDYVVLVRDSELPF